MPSLRTQNQGKPCTTLQGQAPQLEVERKHEMVGPYRIEIAVSPAPISKGCCCTRFMALILRARYTMMRWLSGLVVGAGVLWDVYCGGGATRATDRNVFLWLICPWDTPVQGLQLRNAFRSFVDDLLISGATLEADLRGWSISDIPTLHLALRVFGYSQEKDGRVRMRYPCECAPLPVGARKLR